MTFIELVRQVINQTNDVLRPLKLDDGTESIYKDIEEVQVDKGFIILRAKNEKNKTER